MTDLMTSSRLPLMKIAVIAHPLHAGGGVSVGRNLIAALAEIAPEVSFFVSIPDGLGYEQIVQAIPDGTISVFKDRANLLRRWWFERSVLKPALRRFEPDLVLHLANRGLGGMECPEAILCHNSYLWYPKAHYGKQALSEMAFILLKVFFQRRLLRRALANPRNILLYQTNTARERIHRVFDVKARAVHCPNAVSRFSKQPALGVVPEAMRPYREQFKLFYLTRYYPHKNLESIVNVFREFSGALEGVVVFITIAPEQGRGARRLLEKIERYGLGEKIINLGPLPQERLAEWFSHCDALVMPTLLESFSGTYLEAMHFGLPILTSDLDFAREVCEDAALYFDPWDTKSICRAILMARDSHAMLDTLKKRGRERLQNMEKSWEDIAAEILRRIEDIRTEDA